MSFLKCEIGKPIVLTIDKVTTEKGKFGMQTLFHGEEDSFAMSPDSAKKQLDFIGVSDPTGLTFEFSKVDIGNNRTAINIKQMSGKATSGPAKSQPFDQPVPPVRTNSPQGGEFDSPQYRLITQWVISDIAPLYVDYGCAPDPQTIAAIAATLFIQSNKH